MKVNTKVWFDMHVARRYRGLASATRSLKLRARAVTDAVLFYERKAQSYVVGKYTGLKTKAIAGKDGIVAYEKKAQAYVVLKCNAAKSALTAYTTALTKKVLALKLRIASALQKTKQSIENRLGPYVEALKLRMKRIVEQLEAIVQKIKTAERKTVAYAGQKKLALTKKAKAKIEPVQEYVAEKYDKTSAAATKYTTQTTSFVKSKTEDVLGRERSAKIGNLLNRARSVRSQAA